MMMSPNVVHVRLVVSVCSLFACMVGAAPAAAAVLVADAALINNSTLDGVTGDNGIARSWHTDNTLTTGELTLQNHFRYQNALVVRQPEGPDVALTSGRTAAFDIRFTVLDPTNLGYELSVETVLRGYRTVRSDNGIMGTASAGSFSGRIDLNMDDGIDTLGTQVDDLTILSQPDSSTTSVNSLVDASESLAAGTFFGTRTFGLRFTTSGSVNNVFLQNNGAGEVATRFGLDPVDSGVSGAPPFADAFYPGSDGESATAHGHFANVRVTPLGVVPEPASCILLATGLGLLFLRSLRRK